MAEIKYISQANMISILGKIKATYVQKETGKSLISDELITKLGGIAAGAQVNVLETVKVNGVAQAITEKGVDIAVPTKVGQLENDSKFLTVVTEANLDAALKEKVDASAEGNHSHQNKELLDTYTQTEADLADAVAKKHEHANAAELDKVVDGKVAAWDGAVADVATLKGNASTEGSVDKKIADAINSFATQMTADGTVNTYKEALDYIAAHGAEYTALLGKVTANENAIATLNGDASTAGSVDKKIADAIAAEDLGKYALSTDLDAVEAKVAGWDAAKEDVAAIKADYVKASEMVAYTDEEIDSLWNSAMAV